jgi:asparagine synthase (glutamine-hydrolysing)
MCGIVGQFNFVGARAPIERGLLVAMRDTMEHRGPDGAGVWISEDRRIGLAHRRLSVIDLSPGAAQPMATQDGALTIVFNGEIYNHVAIRRELEALGHRDWQSDHSDTEVILHAFRQWGIDCIHKFRGMFAFALWERDAKALWLVRDRIGVKPLYFALDDNAIVFASEIKALLADRSRRRAVDEEALFHFLSFLTTPAPMTLFAGIRKLPAGSLMRVSQDGTVSERKWWDVLDAASPLSAKDEAEAAPRILSTLREAVALRKVADVPVGVFLSGGLDSSTNLALFSEGAGNTVKAFSISYANDQMSVHDEMPYARLAAQAAGAEHHEFQLTQNQLIDFIPKMIDLQDEPIADPVCVPVYYVSKLAREHGVVVAQVGEGADELFCGYPYWKTLNGLEQANAWPIPAAVKRMGLRMLEKSGRGERTYTEFLKRGMRGQPIFWGGAEAFTEAAKYRLLSPRLREKFAHYSSWEAVAPIRRRFEEKAWERSPLAWMTYLDLNLRLPELLLMRVDKMSMGVGLEARVPFLDHELVRLAMSISAPAKLAGGGLKPLLKRAVRGIVPDAILNRSKQGFAVPMTDWARSRLGQDMSSVLQKFCAETDFFDPAYVDEVLRNGRGPQSWYLMNFALWWRHFIAA